MYFCRFQEFILTNAFIHEIIKDSEKQKILEFWEKDVIYNISKYITTLTSYGLLLEETNESDKFHIRSWPFMKILNLLVCKRNPKYWLYRDDDDTFLFGYIINDNENEMYLNEMEFFEIVKKLKPTIFY